MSENMKNIKRTFLFLFSFIVISCGFHLRGNQDLSGVLAEVSLQGTNKYSELGRELIRALTTAKVNVFDESSTVLNVTSDTFTKRVLSVDNTGKANQYELSYNLSFALAKVVLNKNVAKDKNVNQNKNATQNNKPLLVDLIPAQIIVVKREYLFNPNLILAEADEERRLKADMLQAAMLQVIRRLNFLLNSKNKLKNQKVISPELKTK
jgi:LPS-assembly lipoprotein